MKIIKLRPLLSTENIKETIDFYTKFLGFQCEAYEPEWGWAQLRLGEVQIMLSKPGDLVSFEKPIFTGSLYLNVENIDEVWSQLKDKVKIMYPIQNMEYGMREFGVQDNNGYILMLGQDI